jgi:hypothetical protein
MYQGHPDFLELTKQELELHSAKNRDYAQGGDPLGNFKRVAGILGQYPGLNLSNPTVVAIVYMLKQLDAVLWAMSQGYEGQVESLDDRMQDIHIYMKLARILWKDLTERQEDVV